MTVTTAARALGAGGVLWVSVTAIAVAQRPTGPSIPSPAVFENDFGHHATISTSGAFDVSNPFFQPLGTNGRACSSCHQAADGWTITPAHLRPRFEATAGLDPVFRASDGATSPAADVSAVDARRKAFSLLLSKGLIRIGLPMPADADFELVAVDDPYGHASAADLSLFRRPLPTTNLGFLATVMWDGRATLPGETIHFDLGDQARVATQIHGATTSTLTGAQRDQIVAFELGLFTAQADDKAAGDLRARASGGPGALSSLPFSIGINDVLKPGFDPRAFTLFDPWREGATAVARDAAVRAAQQSIARGQEIFNTRPITIARVNGLNDVLRTPSLQGTCTTCHNTPNVGNHSTSLPLDIGLTTEARRTPDLPLYTFRNKTSGEIVRTTDPGRALITGRWTDMSLFKGPILRALAARPPYFHNGSAATLDDVVEFYNTRFGLGLTAQEKADLVAFLRAL